MFLAWAFVLPHRSTRVTECERWAQADSPQRLHMCSCDGCFHQEETIIAPCHFTPVITLLQTCVSFRCVTAQSSDCSALAFYLSCLGPWYKKNNNKKNLGLSKCSMWLTLGGEGGEFYEEKLQRLAAVQLTLDCFHDASFLFRCHAGHRQD